MAKRAVPEPPLKVPMTDKNNLMSPTWSGWFRDLYQRIGGTLAFSNVQLESELFSDVDSLETRVDALEVNDTAQDASISSLLSSVTTLQEQVDGLLKAPVPE